MRALVFAALAGLLVAPSLAPQTAPREAFAGAAEATDALPQPPTGAAAAGAVALTGPFTHDAGHAWLVPVPAGLDTPADAPGERRSRLQLLEDGAPLGPAHAPHAAIREHGAGRYSHWAEHLWFSTSDGSDPNANGRAYTLRVEPPRLVDDYPLLPLAAPFDGMPPADLARAVAGDPAASAPAHAPPLILWYTIDALRADVWRERAADGPLMPALTAFAEQAVGFERAYAASSFTKASTASMFTGLWPARHGVMHGVVPAWPEGGTLVFDLDPRFYTLAEALRDRGYHTHTHAYSVHVRPGDGLVQGFEHLDWGADDWTALPRPLFVYEHVLGVHGPYDPSDAARARTALPPAEHVDPADDHWFRAPLSEAALAELAAAYRAEAVDADARLAARLQQVRDAGLWDAALIVVTADHGEAFGEHGLTQHAAALYEENVRVPLLVKFPADHRWAARHGERLPQRVSLVDLYPTLLELLGSDPAELPHALDGRSLGPILDGVETEPFARDVFLRSTLLGAPDASGAQRLLVTDAVLQGELKALLGYRLLGSQRPDARPFEAGAWYAELYALDADPRERDDLAPARAAELRRRLDALRALHRPLAADAEHAPPPVDPGAPDPALLEQLRALGYLE